MESEKSTASNSPVTLSWPAKNANLTGGWEVSGEAIGGCMGWNGGRG